MKVLYVFPHPDDESFGIGQVLSKQSRDGHEVYLLTLTKGGATRQREKFGYSVEQMGDVRAKELKDAANVLKVKGLTILNLPDGGLKWLDPRIIENIIRDEILRLKPDVVVTYAVHGISGFHDHLVTHAVVKRVYCELKDEHNFPRRLAFYTMDKESAGMQNHFRLSHSSPDEIKCTVTVGDEDIAKCIHALDCYVTYEDVIRDSGIKSQILHEVNFELFNENHGQLLTDLFEKL